MSRCGEDIKPFRASSATAQQSQDPQILTTHLLFSTTQYRLSNTELNAIPVAMSANRLQGKTVLITGASSGIGRAIALDFARSCPQDLRLIITARRLEPLEDLAKTITHEHGPDGVKVMAYSLDISDRRAITKFINSLSHPIDILVNNAGLARGRARAPDIATSDINLTIDTNILGVIHMTQGVLPMMMLASNDNNPTTKTTTYDTSGTEGREGRKGRGQGRGDIINIGSIAGRNPYAGGSIYCASKSALTNFTDSLRRELIDTRIRVMQIDPGQVEQTEFTTHRLYGDKKTADAFYAGQRSLLPQDVAEIVVFAATRRENVVLADCVVVPNHQAAADVLYKK